jgi:hypothetical protein
VFGKANTFWTYQCITCNLVKYWRLNSNLEKHARQPRDYIHQPIQFALETKLSWRKVYGMDWVSEECPLARQLVRSCQCPAHALALLLPDAPMADSVLPPHSRASDHTQRKERARRRRRRMRFLLFFLIIFRTEIALLGRLASARRRVWSDRSSEPHLGGRFYGTPTPLIMCHATNNILPRFLNVSCIFFLGF